MGNYTVTAKDTIGGRKSLVLKPTYPYTDASCLAAFVSAMNAKAEAIGMENSIFYNPSGRETDGVSLSTAKSLAKLTAFACGYPELCEVWSKSSHVVKIKGQSDLTVESTVFTNSTLESNYTILGGKTGSGTDPVSGVGYYTLVTVGIVKDVMIAGAIMDANAQINRHDAMKQLYDATLAVMNGTTPSPVTLATKACSIVVPTSPRTFTGDKYQVLYEQNADTATGVMSVTKVLTAITLLDTIRDINKSLKFVSQDIVGGSGQYFAIGDIVSMRDLLYAMMLPSSNQAAHALGRVAGCEILKYGQFPEIV